MSKSFPHLAGVGFAIIFGFSFMFTRGALGTVAPFHLLGLRFALAVLTLGLLRLLKIVSFKVYWRQFKDLLPLALFQPLLYFPAETFGVQLTSSSFAGMMIATLPIFALVLGALFLKEKPRPHQYPFILASVAGVILILAFEGQDQQPLNWVGALMLLGAVMAGACYSVASRKASQRYSPLQSTWVMMVVGAAVFNSAALIEHGRAGTLAQYFQPLATLWPGIVYLGVLSSVGAFFLMNYALARIPAAEGTVFSSLTTLVSILAGVLFLSEPLTWSRCVGAVFILTGVWGTNHFGARPAAAKPLETGG